MGYILLGLSAIIVGGLVFPASDTPATMAPSEMLGLLLMAAGAIAVVIGMVVHVAGRPSARRRR